MDYLAISLFDVVVRGGTRDPENRIKVVLVDLAEGFHLCHLLSCIGGSLGIVLLCFCLLFCLGFFLSGFCCHVWLVGLQRLEPSLALRRLLHTQRLLRKPHRQLIIPALEMFPRHVQGTQGFLPISLVYDRHGHATAPASETPVPWKNKFGRDYKWAQFRLGGKGLKKDFTKRTCIIGNIRPSRLVYWLCLITNSKSSQP